VDSFWLTESLEYHEVKSNVQELVGGWVMNVGRIKAFVRWLYTENPSDPSKAKGTLSTFSLQVYFPKPSVDTLVQECKALYRASGFDEVQVKPKTYASSQPGVWFGVLNVARLIDDRKGSVSEPTHRKIAEFVRQFNVESDKKPFGDFTVCSLQLVESDPWLLNESRKAGAIVRSCPLR
jgi:hypothetical protein